MSLLRTLTSEEEHSGVNPISSRWMGTGDKGHDVFTQVRALSMEVKPYSCLINIDDMGSTRVDLPRDQGG